MKLIFNTYLEFAALPFDVGLCIFFFRKYYDRTRVRKEFLRLIVLATAGTVIDIITAFSVSNSAMFPDALNFIIYNLDMLLATFAAYCFVRYVMTYVDVRSMSGTGFVINRTMIFIYVIILIQNIFSGNVFKYPGGSIAFEGPLYSFVVYVFPLYYILFGGIFILRNSKKFTWEMKVGFLFTLCFMVALYSYQMLVDRYMLVTFFGASVSLYVVFLALETPDYSRLKKNIEELEISKRELEAAAVRTNEAWRARTRFMEQAMNEARTPINAITGYSNLIIAETEDENAREYSQRIGISSKRLLGFMDNVMGAVTGETGEGTLKRLPPISELVVEGAEAAASSVSDAALQKEEGVAGIRILVVDDTDMNADILMRMLRTAGFAVDMASNGEQALIQIRKFRYDLIFMDHYMPVMDGVTAMIRICDEQLCDDTPVIMMTANDSREDREKYKEAGFAAFLIKPFTEEDVRKLLDQSLPDLNERMMERGSISDWEELQEKLPTVRVADAREYLLHDTVLYKKLLLAFADEGIGTELSAAVRNKDYMLCRSIIRSQHDMAQLLGAESLARMAEKMESLLKKEEYGLLRERTAAYIAEKNILAEQIGELN